MNRIHSRRPSSRPTWVPAAFVAGLVVLLSACGTTVAPVTPSASSQAVSVGEDGSLDLTLAGQARAGATLDYAIVDAPQHGALQGTAPDLTYVPDDDFLGTDEFTFTVSDGTTTSEPAMVTISVTGSPFYAITRGSSTETSQLYRVDGEGNATLIGDTGHALIAIKVDPTDGTLYGSTRQQDANGTCDNCLVTIDTATAASTVVGALEHDGDPGTTDGPVPSLAFAADGSLYGFSESGDDAVAIDKATGAVTVLGNSGISSYGHGLFFDDAGVLWFINGDGDVYTIDLADGSSALVHLGSDMAAAAGYTYEGDLMVRGDRDPATGKYWGVTQAYGQVLASDVMRLRLDASTGEILGGAPVDLIPGVHNIAFER